MHKRTFCTIHSILLLVLLLVAGSVPAVRADPVVVTLYDGALNTGTPDTQGFSYQAGAQSQQSFANGLTTLTSAVGDLAGYIAQPGRMPQLERETGYEITFSIQVLAEQHVSSDRNGDGIDDRAGFCIVVIGNDGMGIELDFWVNRIWAQEYVGGVFYQAEGQQFDTTAVLRNYRLLIRREQYMLITDGDIVLLTGKLRNYSGFGPPYSLPNFLYLGDNTTSAGATVKLASASVTTGIAPYTIYLPQIVRN